MSLFKKFTDFCAGIAAFVGGLFLLQEYMPFKPLELEAYKNYLINKNKFSDTDIDVESITEAPSKLKQFFTPDITDPEYRIILILVLTLVCSVLIGVILKRFPSICFATSLFPLIIVTYFTTTYNFKNRTPNIQLGLLLAAVALHVAGNVAEAILRDREDGRHRLFVTAKISLLFPAAFCLFFTVIAKKVVNISDGKIKEMLPIFKDMKIELAEPANLEILKKLGWGFVIIFVICMLLYNVYFVDATLSAIPLGYSIYLLYSGRLSFIPLVFFALCAVCFLTNLSLCVFENNLSRKEQIELRKLTEDSSDERV